MELKEWDTCEAYFRINLKAQEYNRKDMKRELIPEKEPISPAWNEKKRESIREKFKQKKEEVKENDSYRSPDKKKCNCKS